MIEIGQKDEGVPKKLFSFKNSFQNIWTSFQNFVPQMTAFWL